MIAQRLKLYNYRNFDYREFEFKDGINLIVGRNAFGKTNILEAIYVGLKGKSFRTLSNAHLIKFGQESARIVMDVYDDGFEDRIDVKIRDKGKKIEVNEAGIETLKSFRQYFDCIVFTPDDLKIIKDSKSIRRKFIDESIAGVDKYYENNIKNYRSVLDQRNQLIRRQVNKEFFSEQLRALDLQLADIGSEIMHRRFEYINRLDERAREIDLVLSDDTDKLDLENSFSISYVEDLKDQKNTYYKELVENEQADLLNRQTNLGIHRDDLSIYINDKEAKFFSSQAQIRTAIIAMKLAQLDLSTYYNDRHPIILLDDVFSELDQIRINYIMDYILDYQSFITSSVNMFDDFYKVSLD